MKKKVHKLDFDLEYEFILIGIVSYENDYRISWSVNKYLDLKLVKTKDLEIVNEKYPEPQKFSVYNFFNEENLFNYNLISNKCNNGFLIEELKNIDYFFQISGEFADNFKQDIVNLLKHTNGVNIVFDIDPNSLRSREKLIF